MWEALLERVARDHMTLPGVDDGWSVKDIIAHVVWYEREMVGLLQKRLLAGSEWWGLPNAERNERIYQQNRLRSLEDVLIESVTVYRQLHDLLEGLSDAELEDPRYFANMPADWVPWQLIAENTYDHYRDHAASIQSWLARADRF